MSRNYEQQRIFVGVIVILILSVSVVALIGLNTNSFNSTDTTDTTDPTNPNNSIYDYENVYTVNDTISHTFADYIPYDEQFTLNSPVYTIESDLSNVVNIGEYGTLSSSVKNKIAQNGFVVRSQSEFKQIHEILEDNENKYPNFISSDAVLHAFHVLYDLALRGIEVYTFWDLLGNLTISLAEDSYGQYLDAPEGRWKDAALRNTAFFYVAAYLIDNETSIPTEVQSDVSEVIALMESHEGYSTGWFMGYTEDFSQYVPRGHYTRSETLEKYFMAMMWYGRVGFHLKPDAPSITNERGMNETAQAILISLNLDNVIESLGIGVSGFEVWDAIYQPTAFFVGDADDLLPTEYRELINETYGTSVTLGVLDNESLLEDFIDTALTFRTPMLMSTGELSESEINRTKGLRFMGQRFIPDSFILSQLVFDHVDLRLLPKGLDVMAALGSDRAWELLEDQKVYENYEEQMQFVWDTVDNITESDWTKNLYYQWLYSLLPLLTDPGEGYPLFMQSEAWVDKQLNAALGSWAELRHDTILYAKQSYTTDSAANVVHGYVEPMPRLYARLASLCKMMISGLEKRELLVNWLSNKLDNLHSFLLSLKEISVKELTGESLNQTEIYIINGAGSRLSDIAEMPTDSYITSDTDEFMAIIADVHTSHTAGSVLEVAVGYPMIIYVAVMINGDVVLTRGGSFSYYEFAHPLNDRLTDEAWQAMLEAGDEPPLPAWTSSFVASEGSTAMMLATVVNVVGKD